MHSKWQVRFLIVIPRQSVKSQSKYSQNEDMDTLYIYKMQQRQVAIVRVRRAMHCSCTLRTFGATFQFQGDMAGVGRSVLIFYTFSTNFAMSIRWELLMHSINQSKLTIGQKFDRAKRDGRHSTRLRFEVRCDRLTFAFRSSVFAMCFDIFHSITVIICTTELCETVDSRIFWRLI